MGDEKSGIVYRHTVETLIKNVLRTHGLLNVRTQAELIMLGIKTDPVQDISFPVWIELLRYSAKLNSPSAPADEAMITLGRRWVEGYDTTLLGKTTGMLARMVGPQKMLLKMTDNWHAANNFYQGTCVARGPRQVDITLNVGGVSRLFNVGIMSRMLEMIGAKNGNVASHEAPPGSHFTVTWG
jgi:uncharacterized protein (TIGR02265 family)